MNEAPNLFADGKAYERLMGRWSRLAGEKFLHWLDAPKNLKWLDVGCGNGAFTELLIARCSPTAVVGVDPSEGQLAYARGRAGTKGAEFRVADAQALPFPDNSFDAATMRWSSSSFPTRARPRANWHGWCGPAVSPPLTCGSFPTASTSRRWRRR